MGKVANPSRPSRAAYFIFIVCVCVCLYSHSVRVLAPLLYTILYLLEKKKFSFKIFHKKEKLKSSFLCIWLERKLYNIYKWNVWNRARWNEMRLLKQRLNHFWDIAQSDIVAYTHTRAKREIESESISQLVLYTFFFLSLKLIFHLKTFIIDDYFNTTQLNQQKLYIHHIRIFQWVDQIEFITNESHFINLFAIRYNWTVYLKAAFK